MQETQQTLCQCCKSLIDLMERRSVRARVKKADRFTSGCSSREAGASRPPVAQRRETLAQRYWMADRE